jgi:hypothetical protein
MHSCDTPYSRPSARSDCPARRRSVIAGQAESGSATLVVAVRPRDGPPVRDTAGATNRTRSSDSLQTPIEPTISTVTGGGAGRPRRRAAPAPHTTHRAKRRVAGETGSFGEVSMPQAIEPPITAADAAAVMAVSSMAGTRGRRPQTHGTLACAARHFPSVSHSRGPPGSTMSA